MQTGLRLGLALAMLAILPASAQERPDFSGEWVRVEPPADAAVVLSIVQTASVIRISNQSADGPGSDTYTLGTRGGIVGGIGSSLGASTTSDERSAVWKETTLVLTQTLSVIQNSVKTPVSGREEVWSFDVEGQLVIVVTRTGPEQHRPRLASFTASGAEQ
jgi:hypothetical protein